MTRVVGTKPPEDPAIEETRKHWALTRTPDQIRAYIDQNVTNLASAKVAIAEIAVLCSALAKRMERRQ